MLVPVARIFGRTLEIVQVYRRAPFPLHLIAECALTLKADTNLELRTYEAVAAPPQTSYLPCWGRTPGWTDTLLGLRRRLRRSRTDRTPAANHWREEDEYRQVDY